MAKIKTNLTINWSLDENHIYLYDMVEEYNLITLNFNKQLFSNKSKDTKIKVLEMMVKTLIYIEKKEDGKRNITNSKKS